jgi:hypothetical protein
MVLLVSCVLPLFAFVLIWTLLVLFFAAKPVIWSLACISGEALHMTDPSLAGRMRYKRTSALRLNAGATTACSNCGQPLVLSLAEDLPLCQECLSCIESVLASPFKFEKLIQELMEWTAKRLAIVRTPNVDLTVAIQIIIDRTPFIAMDPSLF